MHGPSFDATLGDIAKATKRLHLMCCEAERSPRFASIRERLDAIQSDLSTSPDDEIIERSLEAIQEIGAEIGRLQVACCAKARMPLYDTVLRSFNDIHTELNRIRGTGH